MSKRGTREGKGKAKGRERRYYAISSNYATVPIMPVIVDTQEDLQYSEHTCHLSKAMLNA